MPENMARPAGPLPHFSPRPEGAPWPWQNPPPPSPAALALLHRQLSELPTTPLGPVPTDPAARRRYRRRQTRRWLHSLTAAELRAEAVNEDRGSMLRKMAAHHLQQRLLGALVFRVPRRSGAPQLPALRGMRAGGQRVHVIVGFSGRVDPETGEPLLWRREVPWALVEAALEELRRRTVAARRLLELLRG